MNIEEKAKAYDKALSKAREYHFQGQAPDKLAELEAIFPELRENEDERMMRVIDLALTDVPEGRFTSLGTTLKDCLAYLEKQKYNRMQPVYDNQESFESALDRAWKSYNESGSRTVDSCEDDYVECAHAKGFREGYLFGLEKLKDASKAIEAVERIDKYIDEHLANAHDMKDSNPDKKYYRGWDDALGKMAGILQDVYSGEKHKEQSLRDFIDDFPYSEQKEQKHVELNNRLEEISRNGLENAHTIDFSKEYENSKQILEKSVNCKEWSEEDEKALREVKLNFELNHDNMTPTLVDFYERFFNKLKSLRPQLHWKSSEEQMEALKEALETYKGFEEYDAMKSLYNDLKKLM